MGHYWSETEPAAAEAQAQRIERKRRLREGLLQLPLGEFTVEELEALLTLFGLLYRDALGTLEPDEAQLELLERRVKQNKGVQVQKDGATECYRDLTDGDVI